MFVYSGTFSWKDYAKKETFILILPNGHVRAGDSVYFFSQWTEDEFGNHKKNWFDKLAIRKVKKSSTGDDIFTLEGSWYTAEITTQNAYGSLSVSISNHRLLIGKHKETFTVKRFWQPQDQHPTDDLRIWTGNIDWLQFAKNELAMFILPDGFGEGKPVLSIWQWTKSSSGAENNLQFREATQKALPSPGDGLCKFSYNSYYDITCTWNKKTDQLSVNMKENSHSADIGVMSLSVHIQRHSHHTFNPVKPATVTKHEFPVSLPQAQPTLPRILTPLPFPDGILETMAQSVAFADHAAYLVKSAQDRFNALDTDLHKRVAEIATLNDEKDKLNLNVRSLTGKLESEQTRAAKLEKELADAKAAAKSKEAELTKKYQDLEDKTSQHDKHDHDVLHNLRKELDAIESKIHTLEAELAKARVEISTQKTQLKTAQTTITKLQNELHDVKAKYDVEYKENKKLHDTVIQIEKEKHALDQKVKDLQLSLDKANKLYGQSQDELKAKSDILVKEQAKVKTVEKERDTALAAQAATAAALVVSEAKAGKLEKELQKNQDLLTAAEAKNKTNHEEAESKSKKAREEAEKNIKDLRKQKDAEKAQELHDLREKKDKELSALRDTKDDEKDKALHDLGDEKDTEKAEALHDLTKKKDKELHKLGDEKDAEKAKEIHALKEKKEKEISELRKKLNAEKDQALHDLREEKDKEISVLKEKIDA